MYIQSRVVGGPEDHMDEVIVSDFIVRVSADRHLPSNSRQYL